MALPCGDTVVGLMSQKQAGLEKHSPRQRGDRPAVLHSPAHAAAHGLCWQQQPRVQVSTALRRAPALGLPLLRSWGCLCPRSSRGEWQGPRVAPGCASRVRTSSRREDGAAGWQCELVQAGGRGWPGRILRGSPASGRTSCSVGRGQQRDLPASLGTGAPKPSVGYWSGVVGAARSASQLPPTAIPLRGNPAGPHSSVQLWFKQLIF